MHLNFDTNKSDVWNLPPRITHTGIPETCCEIRNMTVKLRLTLNFLDERYLHGGSGLSQLAGVALAFLGQHDDTSATHHDRKMRQKHNYGVCL